MFIGERNKNNNLDFDTNELASDLIAKMDIPSMELDIIEPINDNTHSLIDPLQDPIIGSYTNTQSIYNRCNAIYNKIDSGSNGGSSSAVISTHPKLLHTEYTFFSLKYAAFIYDGKPTTIEEPSSIPAKIEMFDTMMKIKLYKGFILNNVNTSEHADIYLADEDLIKAAPGKEELLALYYDKVLQAFPNDGSNIVPFPIINSVKGNDEYEKIIENYGIVFGLINDEYKPSLQLEMLILMHTIDI